MDLIAFVKLIPPGTTIWIDLNGESTLLDLWSLAAHAYYGVKRVNLVEDQHLNIQIFEREQAGFALGFGTK